MTRKLAPGSLRNKRRVELATVLPLVLCAGFGASEPSIIGILEASKTVSIAAQAIVDSNVAAAVLSHKPDVVVLGWNVADLRDVHELARAHPSTGIIAVVHDAGSTIANAFRTAGAAAVIASSASPRMLLATVVVVTAGMRVAPRDNATDTALLSRREAKVADLLNTELSTAQIASMLHVSIVTVRSQTKSVYKKLGVHSREEFRRLHQMSSRRT